MKCNFQVAFGCVSVFMYACERRASFWTDVHLETVWDSAEIEVSYSAILVKIAAQFIYCMLYQETREHHDTKLMFF